MPTTKRIEYPGAAYAVSGSAHVLHRSKGKGFTLIEALIASVVLAFSVVAISGAMVASATASNEIDARAALQAEAQAALDVVLARPLASVINLNGATTQTLNPAVLGAVTVDASVTLTITAGFVQLKPTAGARDMAVVTVVARSAQGMSSSLSRLITIEGTGR